MVDKPLVSDVFEYHGTAVKSMQADTGLKEAIEAFVRNPSLRGLFLVDSNQRFIGMITRVNLIKWAHLNVSGGKGTHHMSISEIFSMVDARKAKDLMNNTSLSVKEGDTLQAALNKMVDHEEDVLPVVDSSGRIIGDLMLSEVLWWIMTHGKGVNINSK